MCDQQTVQQFDWLHCKGFDLCVVLLFLQSTKIIELIKFGKFMYRSGARGGIVVKALRYKPAGRGFDSRRCYWNFSVT